jgi:hypothetical protein
VLVLIQRENLLGSAPRTAAGTPPAARLFLYLPVLQTANLLAAALVRLAAHLLAGRRGTRTLFLALRAAVAFYLVADQVDF